ncbi:TPA: hypothetical protein DEW47_00965 [Patescibacteria group bacterium]|nr:MAG: Peptidase, M23/M37 family [Parcubacteria group bacterium GW2011_GWF2_40_10]KKR47637.1 MAG: Peptidase, M23/M37 family [Parcubacteria group bacterium GW2011_GWA2_40_143]KKR60002.1 MAG: Peptidase, M23/M37 family [Parcubacteria group bacterium GW2011_GWC2_40_31]KKR75536.1 MAG: Peptidase, M23/M37 family [Parcubacteria group bacterium GW2011_GWB2_40_8]KKR76593.1 MAG: Peptidase, M23/M37 family [Parcubacteria group bacterium GW2011_GWE2_40_8]KKR82723.1 MAG: Peptidase, M23/M37 family [Parcubact
MPLKKYKKILLPFFLFLFLAASYFLPISNTRASRVDELKDQIKDRNLQIAEIEKEIKKYEQEVENTGKEANTLNNHIKILEAEKKKLAADINLTQNKINAAELNIEKLGIAIGEKEEDIEDKRFILAKILREINDIESASLIEIALSEENFSDFFSNVERVNSLRNGIQENLNELKVIKSAMEMEKKDKENYRKDLGNLQSKYVDQKYLVEVNKSNKNKLLTETKNKEAEYQKRLAEQKAAREQFEADLRKLESQLQFELDPDSIPSAKKGVLRWPLDNVYITQYFGNTEFAKNGAYNGKGHNGVDFRASEGTEIKAALEGEVIAINSKVAYMCQYGKWVLIRHPNGLTTLYAHLSLVPDRIKVGQKVTMGQVIGYSGSTGYSTGPHLHFTVYASKAVQFKEYTCNSGATLTIPVAAYSGYLNPMSYF